MQFLYILSLLLFLLGCCCLTVVAKVQTNKNPFRHHPASNLFKHGRRLTNSTKYVNSNRYVNRCKIHWFEQELDHFNGDKQTYRQRYYICSEFWNKAKDSPIFFYSGNEGDVELYLEHTGIMWENAASFGALMVFAEHRYYGKSLPFNKDPLTLTFDELKFLTSEQALADFAILIDYLKEKLNIKRSAVISFGGSYGGMLSSWFRIKYPWVVDGAIAGSAPILAFGEDKQLAYDSETYWGIVTNDAIKCAAEIRNAFQLMIKLANTEVGRMTISKAFQMCSPLQNEKEVKELMEQYKFAFDTMAMGNFPYASDYLTGGDGTLPPNPVSTACDMMHSISERIDEQTKLLKGLHAAGEIFINVTGKLKCNILPADLEEDGIWDFQWCLEMLPQETYFTCDGVRDMFWPEKFDQAAVDKHCMEKYGVQPRKNWIPIVYGGLNALETSSNIVFTNGILDPWSSGGVRQSISSSIIAVSIVGAHHQDLFFANDLDHFSVKEARKIHLDNIRKWIKQKRENLNK